MRKNYTVAALSCAALLAVTAGIARYALARQEPVAAKGPAAAKAGDVKPGTVLGKGTFATVNTTVFAGENARKMMTPYFPVQAKLSDEKPVGIVKEPTYRGKPRYATVMLGNGPNAATLVAVDDVEGGGGKLYTDANRDGDLTNDGDGAWAGEAKRDGIVGYAATTRVLRASYGTPGKEESATPYSLGFYYREGGASLLYFRQSGRVGTVTVGDKTYPALLVENDGDAIFGKPAPTDPKVRARPLWLFLDLNNTGEFGPSSKMVAVNSPFRLFDTTYEAQVSPDGSALTLVKSAKEIAPPPPPRPAVTLLGVGKEAPDFTVDTPTGEKVTLASLRGKVVVLDFWATWCGPCMASMPHLQQVYAKLKDRNDFAVLAVCVSDERAAFQKWVAANKSKYTFPFLMDPAERDSEKSISRAKFGVSGIPTTFVIGKDGNVVESIVGYSGENDHRLEAALAKAGIEVP